VVCLKNTPDLLSLRVKMLTINVPFLVNAMMGLVLLILAQPPLLAANQEPEQINVPDISELGMEALLNLDVTSVTKVASNSKDVPSAIYVLTSEEIHRTGATTIPEALRVVPGLHVARIDGSRWAVSARGFSNQYANKLLVLMDGRSLYSPMFSGVWWDQEDVLMEDIDRIEVIRGSGASLWGANAVNGVINIITKKAKNTQGGLVVGHGGSMRKGGSLRYGVELVVTGYQPAIIRQMMNTAVEADYERSITPVAVLRNMASTAPAFGMVGTLVGMVIMLQNIQGDMTKIGAGLAVALLATLYGIIMARLFCLPAADKLLQKEDIMRFRNYMMTEGLVLLAEKQSPRFMQDRLNSFLEPSIHFNLDEQLKQPKKANA
jgi:biopolymer transport protein ExbB/TolQ